MPSTGTTGTTLTTGAWGDTLTRDTQPATTGDQGEHISSEHQEQSGNEQSLAANEMTSTLRNFIMKKEPGNLFWRA